MKSNSFVCLLLIGLVLINVTGCASMKGRWKKVEDANTIEAYEEFLRQYPESEFSEEALLRIQKLHFEEAQSKGDIIAYAEFIARYPDGNFVDEARLKIEELRFIDAKSRNTAKSFTDFLKLYPNGELANEAIKLLPKSSFDGRFMISEIKADNYSKVDKVTILQYTDNNNLKMYKLTYSSSEDIIEVNPYANTYTKISPPQILLHNLDTDSGVVHGGDTIIPSYRKTLPIPLPPPLPFGLGSIHIFEGVVRLSTLGFRQSIVKEIRSDPYNPISFIVTDLGYVHLDGIGTVVFYDGRSFDLQTP